MSRVVDEAARATALLDAQDKAEQLFAAAQPLVVAGVGERELSDRVRDLAAEMFGVRRHWHKRIVRSGPNTLHPYRKRPPDRVITDDDIVFFDFGPVFAKWEADVGRTYVLGGDPVKLRLRDDLPIVWEAGKRWFDDHPEATGAELFAHVEQLANASGWEFGGEIAGHLVGEFPHERIKGGTEHSYIAPGNPEAMRGTDSRGRLRHWILEIHLVDRARRIGGFHEQLLTLP